MVKKINSSLIFLDGFRDPDFEISNQNTTIISTEFIQCLRFIKRCSYRNFEKN